MNNLPFPKYMKGKIKMVEHVLTDDYTVEQWFIPKGTKVKLVTSANFGTMIIPKDTQDIRGFTIPRRIFRW